MTTNPQGGGFQQQVLRSFTALMLLRLNWAGELVLGLGLNDEGAALALAAHIAGAVCLSIEPDVALVKAAQRRGACDFAVNTLDEALRTMKNEVRQGRALSVALHGSYDQALSEAAERGLLPAVIFGRAGDLPEAAAQAVTRLQQLGSSLICLGGCGTHGCTDASVSLEAWAAQHSYQLQTIPAASPSGLAALDDILKRQLSPDDILRHRWLDRARQHFLRDRPLARAAWLTPAEADRLQPPAATIQHGTTN